jgi:hypothetical protein
VEIRSSISDSARVSDRDNSELSPWDLEYTHSHDRKDEQFGTLLRPSTARTTTITGKARGDFALRSESSWYSYDGKEQSSGDFFFLNEDNGEIEFAHTPRRTQTYL